MRTHVVAETAALTGRSMKHVGRSPDTVITTAVMPVAMMLLFVYVFGGAIDTGGVSDRYIDYMLPGILLATVATGVSYTVLRNHADLNGGFFDRFHSLPISRSATLWAHVLTSVASTAGSLVTVVAAALLMGFRSGAGKCRWTSGPGGGASRGRCRGVLREGA